MAAVRRPPLTKTSRWRSSWQACQDRRARIRLRLEGLKGQQQVYIENLDGALKIIAQVGIVYNRLEHSAQRGLLRQVVERVIVDDVGQATLELRAPFACLNEISHQVRGGNRGASRSRRTQTGSHFAAGSQETQCSDWVLSCGRDRIRTCDPV